MSDFKNVIKGGWHPKGKDGGKESWRGDFKGINQVAGWMGKGKQPGANEPSEHISRPLTSLKDPSLFGPPPKNVNYHGGAALPNEITPHTGGLGAPLTKQEIDSATRTAQQPSEEEIEEQQRPAGPPLPYRADRTGLQTSHLPPPPTHRDVAANADNSQGNIPKPKPGLPPRLPERRNTPDVPVAVAVSSPPAYESVPPARSKPISLSNGGLGQTAMNRLGNVGVSVPGLGIGTSEKNPWKNEPSQTTASPLNSQQAQPTTSTPNLSELQSRFARMNSNSSANASTYHTPAQSPPPIAQHSQPEMQTTTSPPPSQGTTWAEKQAALRTAQNFHKDPSTVTMADAQSAASTANNFRERHQESINAGAQKANTWNKKYNMTGRLNSFLEKQASPPPVEATSNPPPQVVSPMPAQAQTPEVTASISRKPPPPPPSKKPGFLASTSTSSSATSPPPVPLGTKPNFG